MEIVTYQHYLNREVEKQAKNNDYVNCGTTTKHDTTLKNETWAI